MRPLSGEEEELAGLLGRAGLSARAARVLAALLRGGGHVAAELGEATGLARQEAGEGARELEGRGLARVESVATGGRPSKRYHLARDPAAAMGAFLAARRAAIRAELDALDALEARFR